MTKTKHDKAVRGDDPASGMTIRERVAMAAMQSISISGAIERRSMTPYDVTHAAVTLADALLTALEARHDD